MGSVTFRDGAAGGRAFPARAVGGLPDRMTVRELVGLWFRQGQGREDWERQAAAAGRAFAANGFFVLAGDRQIEDLDEVVDLTAGPELVFIRLIPLAGG